MISLPSQIQSLLEGKAIVPIKNNGFLLREKKVMTVKVVEVHNDVTVINLNKIGSLGGVKSIYHSRCDYLILCQSCTAVTAIFVELKKTLSQERKALEQLRSASPYLSFLTDLARVVGTVEQQLPSIAVQHVLIGSRVTPLLNKLRLGDPQALPDETYCGITVRRLVGLRHRFSKLVQAS